MEIAIKKPEPSRFETLMWNDSFALACDYSDIFVRIQDIPNPTQKGKECNCFQLGVKDNSVNPLRFFEPNTEIYRVYIVKIEVQGE